MNSKAILGIAAVMLVASIGTAYAIHATWQSATGTVVVGVSETTLTVNAVSQIPAHTKDLAGFAFLYDDTSAHTATVFAVTTHHGVKDSTQRPNQWHTHNIALGGGSGAAEFCVADIEDAPFAKINVNQSTLTVRVDNSALQSGLAYFGGFDIIVELTCPITKIGGVDNPFGLRLGVDAA